MTGASLSRTRIVSVTPLPIERDSRTFKQAVSIARLGYDSIVAEGGSSRLDRHNLPFALQTLPAPGSRRPPRRAVRIAFSAVRRLGRHARRVTSYLDDTLALGPALPSADLYCLHGYGQYPAVRRACRSHRALFLYDAHDFYPPGRRGNLGEGFGARAEDLFYLALERHCLRSAAAAITSSGAIATLIEQRFGRRPEVVLNAHDSRLDDPTVTPIRRALGVGDDVFLVLVSGNAGKPGLALSELLTAVAGLPSRVHLALVGQGYESESELARTLGIERRVHLVEPVSPAQYAPFLQGADVAVIPYFAQSDMYAPIVPNRFFVPLSAGIPVLYPKGLTEQAALAAKYDVGLSIDPQRPATITAAICRLLNDHELLAGYRDNARVAGEQLAWEREETRLATVLEDALKRVH